MKRISKIWVYEPREVTMDQIKNGQIFRTELTKSDEIMIAMSDGKRCEPTEENGQSDCTIMAAHCKLIQINPEVPSEPA